MTMLSFATYLSLVNSLCLLCPVNLLVLLFGLDFCFKTWRDRLSEILSICCCIVKVLQKWGDRLSIFFVKIVFHCQSSERRMMHFMSGNKWIQRAKPAYLASWQNLWQILYLNEVKVITSFGDSSNWLLTRYDWKMEEVLDILSRTNEYNGQSKRREFTRLTPSVWYASG